MKLSNFGFSIPTGATILGVEVIIARKATHASGGNRVRDLEVVLIKANGTLGSTNKAVTGTDWTTSEADASYGDSSVDLWGETLTAEDINDIDFGVAIRATITNQSAAVQASIDYVSMTVCYEAADGFTSILLRKQGDQWIPEGLDIKRSGVFTPATLFRKHNGVWEEVDTTG